jgi:DNA-binding response OmpR family regulator
VKTCLGYQPVSALFTLLAANRPVQKEGRYGSLIDREKAIVLRPSVRAVVLGGSDTVFLTPGEWKVFFCLWENRGKVVSRETLRSLFGPRHSNLVDSYISFLREKLEKPRNQRLIITIRGEGYTIRNDAELEK